MEDCSGCPPGTARTDGKTCQDINECVLEPGLCRGGTCLNTEGSFVCHCPDGLTLDTDGQTFIRSKSIFSFPCPGRTCIDRRLEPCYLEYMTGMCLHSVLGLFSRATCCCTLGQAWGLSCARCPRPGSPEHAGLCGGSEVELENNLGEV